MSLLPFVELLHEAVVGARLRPPRLDEPEGVGYGNAVPQHPALLQRLRRAARRRIDVPVEVRKQERDHERYRAGHAGGAVHHDGQPAVGPHGLDGACDGLEVLLHVVGRQVLRLQQRHDAHGTARRSVGRLGLRFRGCVVPVVIDVCLSLRGRDRRHELFAVPLRVERGRERMQELRHRPARRARLMCVVGSDTLRPWRRQVHDLERRGFRHRARAHDETSAGGVVQRADALAVADAAHVHVAHHLGRAEAAWVLRWVRRFRQRRQVPRSTARRSCGRRRRSNRSHVAIRGRCIRVGFARIDAEGLHTAQIRGIHG
mmetsp:Transcript_39870/g.123198  ORF Transcript_39870/g.123198 Transcript_39870/m.123198 type:complete len:316 (-) Transcript_39870:25-972(-)